MNIPDTPDQTKQKNNYIIGFLGLIFIFLVIRLYIIGHLGLGDDEAYYWDWSRHLSLSYYDHPPVIAYLIALFTWIGNSSEFFVRLGIVLMFFGSNFLLFDICRKLFDGKTGFWAILIINLIPVFAIGAIFAAPDGPLGFFFMLAIYFFIKSLDSGKVIFWYLWGMSLGFCLLSKYNGILVIISFLLYMLISKKRVQFLRNTHIYIAIIISFLIFLPVIIWNYQNNWASFQFQFLGGHGGHFSITNLLLFIGSQTGLLAILFYPILVFSLLKSGWKGIKNNDERFLLLFSLSAPTLLLFHLASPLLSFKPHWTALGYIPLIIASVQMARENWTRSGVKTLSAAAIVLAFGLTAVMHIQAFYPVIDGKMLQPKYDITNELYGWREAGAHLEILQKHMIKDGNDNSTFLFSYRYQLVGQIAFYSFGQPQVYSLNNWNNAYDYFQKSDTLTGKNGIFVCDNRFDRRPDEFCQFDSITEENDLPIIRAGREVRRFHFYKCFYFRGIKR